MSENFKIYFIKEEFFSITDWAQYKIPIKEKRPVLILVIEKEEFPDGLFCIPITKDDDKNRKIKALSMKRPDFIHPIKINRYDSYLLIQNMYILHKEFLGEQYTLNGVPFEIKNTKIQREIMKKVKKVDALLKRGIINYVPREKVFEIQLKYLEEKKRKNP
ncbi:MULTISPECIES: hypothetical protein [Anoxybacillaceae]|uniref:PemK-like, MazF-like toxin of type II toxin-antitoxin system n=2 Tax=Anoxybacillaceae TaxID=3120669 RepID=A0A327XZ60_9BACL|nr:MULTISPECIES: hypothetical protein [Bacillaceae]AEH49794.1 hypothetical protein Geoth_3993 [Parageobacillus thermoglucosidasius C56-YS93]MBY6269968.1 hypothetical protein [Parageobacillus thermoglucosidasius]OUM83885.1 MAG: hypothetical protein BAA00_12500 [Parageobacillus thermoglucosidasius]RAK13894.1 hypothetical protein B0I26_1457 [Anoxybacillus vitaminiphilus]GMO01276.1 hypothetical protein PthstB1num2_33160 [Parageobacillus thermoglucosidasius]